MNQERAANFYKNRGRPVSPPKKIIAPTIFAPKKANATGIPNAISPKVEPINRAITQYHSTGNTPPLGR